MLNDESYEISDNNNQLSSSRINEEHCSKAMSASDDDCYWHEQDDENYDNDFVPNHYNVDGDIEDAGDDHEIDYDVCQDDPTYNIWEDIIALSEVVINSKQTEKRYLYNNSRKSTEQFAHDLKLFVHRNIEFKRGEQELMSLLDEYFPAEDGFCLPVKRNRKGFTQSDLDNYQTFRSEGLKFDVCKTAGCTVYAGAKSDLFKCPSCDTPRYKDCTHPSCKKSQIFDESKCNHRSNPQFRTVLKTMTYRPLHTTLCRLLCTPGFVIALKYRTENYEDGIMRDLTDSPHCKKHLSEMHDIFLAQEDEEYEEVNILLSEFYDGAQIYRWKTSKFYPFVIGILNLPPSYRGKIGAGLFLSTLFSSEAGSAAEDFIFKTCLITELQKFYEGVKINVGGKKYFVQARLILHICDTIGLQYILRCTGHKSIAGCPLCNVGGGITRSYFKKVFFPDARVCLSDKHWLRFTGQQKCCCPELYYKMNDKEAAAQGIDFFIEDKKRCCSTKYDSKGYYDFANNKKWDSQKEWHHKDFPYEVFKTKLRYHYYDLRDPIKWERRPNEFYIENGKKAHREKKAINGVKGLWYFYFLLYANVPTDISYDLMHIFKNLGSAFLKMLLGKRLYPPRLQTYLEKCNIKDWDVKNFPWILSSNDKIRIDCWLECICIPKGFAKNFDVKMICEEPQFIKCSGYITILTALMPFIMTAAYKLPIVYKNFFEMLSIDLTDLIAVEINPNELDELFLRLIESLCIKDGLFPDTEKQIIFHQIMDLRSSLENFGPLRHTWAMAGERSIRRIKDLCHSSYDQNNLSSYSSFEVMQTKNIYNFYLVDLYNDRTYQVSTNDETKVFVDEDTLFYNDRRLYISQKDSNRHKLTPIESNNFICAIINESYRLSNRDDTEAAKNSRLYRLYKIYTEEKIDRIETNFFLFVKAINLCRLGKVNLANDLMRNVNDLMNTKLYDSALLEDLHEVEHFFTKVYIYRKAVIYGIKFKSRGVEFSESEDPNPLKIRWGSDQRYTVFQSVNIKNDLSKYWNLDKSTWAKFRVYSGLPKINSYTYPGPKERYAQNNYFLCAQMIKWGELKIDNILFANVTARHFKENKIYCKPTDENNLQVPLYDNQNTFVPLSNFLSTAVAFCPFGKSTNGEFKPYCWKIIKGKFCEENKSFFCNNRESIAEYLYMIDIHPERKCINKDLK